MAEENKELARRLDAQEQATKAQQQTLDTIQCLLEQLMKEKVSEKPFSSGGGQNSGPKDDSGSGNLHHEEENIHFEIHNEEAPPRIEDSLVNSDVIRNIQEKIASLTHREEAKKHSQ